MIAGSRLLFLKIKYVVFVSIALHYYDFDVKITVAHKAQTQINFPKHKSVSKNTSQFPKTQINFPKHKYVFQNTN